MELLLWRHAEAVDLPERGGDMQRELTPLGRQQAKQVAHWLAPRLAPHTRILVSPALRTQQTARALTDQFTILHEIGTGGYPEDILRVTGWPDAKGMTLVVGHQPTLGALASLLLTGHAAGWEVKKGALWWFKARRGESLLRAVISPDLCDAPDVK
ncbi:MAG: histidine phosphatase family protein [Burkholderiaceae bacterium]|nr:MAG: histidine phosphatase family protein [Burkholderiaceae bacterium]